MAAVDVDVVLAQPIHEDHTNGLDDTQLTKSDNSGIDEVPSTEFLEKTVDDASNESGALPVAVESNGELQNSTHDVAVVDETASAEEIQEPPEVVETLAESASDVAEEAPAADQPPSRPWTPSYSVTTQGPGTPQAEEQEQPVEPVELIVTVSDEVPAVETNPELDDARPKSPWTPSYSVVVQGSPNVPAIELDADAIQGVTAEEELVVEEAAPLDTVPNTEDTSLKANAEPERPEGEASALIEPETLVALDEAEGPEVASAPTQEVDQEILVESTGPVADSSMDTTASTIVDGVLEDLASGVKDEVNAISVEEKIPVDAALLEAEPLVPEILAGDAQNEDTSIEGEIVETGSFIVDEVDEVVPESTSQDSLAIISENIERPQSPWTPSYSVTSQGPGIEAEDELQLPPPAETTVTISEAPVEPVVETSAETENPRPTSPWTPSYSVVVQGSPNIPPVELSEPGSIETDTTSAAAVDLVLEEAPTAPEVASETQEEPAPLATIAADVVEAEAASENVLEPESAVDVQPVDEDLAHAEVNDQAPADKAASTTEFVIDAVEGLAATVAGLATAAGIFESPAPADADDRVAVDEPAGIPADDTAETETTAAEEALVTQSSTSAEELQASAAEEAEKREQERLEAERLEQQRLEEAQRAEDERVEQERIAKLEQERLEQQRLEDAKRAEDERIELERLQAQQEQERLEQERIEQERLEEQQRLTELAEAERVAEEARRAEEERLAEQARLAKLEQERLEEEQRLADEAEAARLAAEAEEQRLADLAEAQRLADEAKRAEQERAAEQARLDEERRLAELAEAKRLADEAEAARLAAEAEEQRLADEARRAEEERLAEEARLEEERRLAELAEAKRLADEAEAARIAAEAEEQRLAELAEAQRLADEAKRAEEERVAEQARLEEERRLAELAEAKRLADEAEAARLAAEAEEQRLADEAKRAEEERLAEEARLEEERLAELAEAQRLADEAKRAEEERVAEEARLEEERRLAELAEAKRLAEEAETARLAAEAEEQRLAELAEVQRLANEAKRLEEERAAEQARLEEEQRLAELAEAQRVAEEAEAARLAAEAEEQRLAEIAEARRLADEAKRAEEERAAEQARLEEEQRLAELAEAQRLADEAEAARVAAEAEQQRLADEAKRAEEERLAEEARLEEERRLAELAEAQRLADEAEAARLAAEAEEQRLAELAEAQRLADEAKRAEEERAAEQARLEEEQRLAELAEAKRLADEAEAARLAAEVEEQRIAELAEAQRLADEAKRAEEERAAEQARLEEEQRVAELAKAQRLADEAAAARVAAEAEERRLAELAEEAKLAEQKEQERLAKIAEEQKLADEAARGAEQEKPAEISSVDAPLENVSDEPPKPQSSTDFVPEILAAAAILGPGGLISEQAIPTVSAQEITVNGSSESVERSWTPSYSVTTHGPGIGIEVPKHVETTTIQVSEENSNDVGETITHDDLLSSSTPEIERPKSPWTPSYSVVQQGPGIDPVDEVLVLDQPTLTISEVSNEPPAIAEDNVRPKSPWTPSYSVVVQGSSVPVLELDATTETIPAVVDPATLHDPDVEEHTGSPDPASDAVVAALVESGVVSDEPVQILEEVSTSAAPVDGPSPADLKEVVAALEAPREDAAGDLSASSTNQPTPLASAKALPELQTFPITGDLDDEIDDMVPPLSPRSRLESTASSLYFPGAWFSKLPEGRASLEVAAGEFTPSKNNPPLLTTTRADEVVQKEEAERKGKWCIVM
uniref:Uncharacterized protein n=1 Tax=Mycena chlorophos TaxID=658473 RepID=A0ABQ0MBY2_MYCCL|nr:predicted protein [Mycena chlorophos]